MKMSMIHKICNCIAILGLLCVCSITNANDLLLDVNLASKHLEGGQHNEKNLGLGATYNYSAHMQLKAGFYDNSYYNNSFYGVVNFTDDFSDHVNFGFGVGVVTGYHGTPGEEYEIVDNVQVMILPNIDLHTKRFHTIIGMLPNVFVLQVQYKIK